MFVLITSVNQIALKNTMSVDTFTAFRPFINFDSGLGGLLGESTKQSASVYVPTSLFYQRYHPP